MSETPEPSQAATASPALSNIKIYSERENAGSVRDAIPKGRVHDLADVFNDGIDTTIEHPIDRNKTLTRVSLVKEQKVKRLLSNVFAGITEDDDHNYHDSHPEHADTGDATATDGTSEPQQTSNNTLQNEVSKQETDSEITKKETLTSKPITTGPIATSEPVATEPIPTEQTPSEQTPSEQTRPEQIPSEPASSEQKSSNAIPSMGKGAGDSKQRFVRPTIDPNAERCFKPSPETNPASPISTRSRCYQVSHIEEIKSPRADHRTLEDHQFDSTSPDSQGSTSPDSQGSFVFDDFLASPKTRMRANTTGSTSETSRAKVAEVLIETMDSPITRKRYSNIHVSLNHRSSTLKKKFGTKLLEKAKRLISETEQANESSKAKDVEVIAKLQHYLQDSEPFYAMALYQAAKQDSISQDRQKVKKRMKVRLHSRKTSGFFKKLSKGNSGGNKDTKTPKKKIRKSSAADLASEAETKWLHMTPRSRIQSRARIMRALTDKTLSPYFHQFQKESLCEENFLFWQAVERYKSIDDIAQRIKAAEEVYNEYIAPDAPLMVNLSGRIVTETEINIDLGKVECFAEPQEVIMQLMQEDSYPKFLKSKPFEVYSFRNVNKHK